MTEKQIHKAAFTIGSLVAAGLLLGALDRHPYSYYILLRWVTFGVCVLGVVLTVKLGISALALWTFIIVGFVFNPLIPIHMSRDTWLYFDVAAAIIVVGSNAFIWLERPKTTLR